VATGMEIVIFGLLWNLSGDIFFVLIICQIFLSGLTVIKYIAYESLIVFAEERNRGQSTNKG